MAAQSIDETVQVAILTILKFALEPMDDPQTFVSFAAPAPVYTAPDIAQLSAKPENMGALRLQAEFSQFVNTLPGPNTFLPLDRRFCWDAFREITRERSVALARPTRTPAEETALKRALAVVSGAPDENGFRPPSQKLKTYESHRDAHIATMQQMLARKVAVELANNPETTAHWDTVEKPEYQRRVAEALANWRTNGFKDEVELAQQTIDVVSAKAPLQQWMSWRGKFDPNIDLITASGIGRFAPTGLSPQNFLASPTWPTVRLSAAEVYMIAYAHDPVFRNGATHALDLSGKIACEFEYTTVLLQRSWFAPELLRARFWKTIDDGEVLSDGVRTANGAGKGRLSAYPVAAVFLRRVKQIRTGAAVASPPPPPAWGNIVIPLPPPKPIFPNLPGTPIKPPKVSPVDPEPPWFGAFDGLNHPALGNPRLGAAGGFADVIGDEPAASGVVHFGDVAFASAPAEAHEINLDQLSGRLGLWDDQPLAAEDSDRVEDLLKNLRPSLFQRRPELDQLLRPASPRPPTPVGAQETDFLADGSAMLIGILYRQTPLSPDPDPSLTWDD